MPNWQWLTNSALLVSLCISSSVAAENSSNKAGMDKAAQEKTDRLVDVAAYQAQSRAQSQLFQRIGKTRNEKAKAEFMIILTELFKEKAAIAFRLSSYQPKYKQLYKRDLEQLITTSKETVRILGTGPDSDRMYFFYATAVEEKGEKQKAEKAYASFLDRYPSSVYRPPVLMAYTAMLSQNNRHKEVIQRLREIEADPKIPYWPFAMHRMGWSYFNLAMYPQAISSLTRLLQTSKDSLIVESACLDQATFAAEGIEKKVENINVDGTIETLKKTCINEDQYKKAKMRLAKIFRSHRLDSELAQVASWNKREGDWESFGDVAILRSDYAFQKRDWSVYRLSLRDLIESFEKTKNASVKAHIQKCNEELIRVILKNKKSTEIQVLVDAVETSSKTLVGLIDSDKEKGKILWNLAELYYSLEKWEPATAAYIESEKFSSNPQTTLRKISARYQSLIHAYPLGELKASKWVSEGTRVPVALSELKSWIEASPSKVRSSKEWIAFYLAAIEIWVKQSNTQTLSNEFAKWFKDNNRYLNSEQQERWAGWLMDTQVANSNWAGLIEMGTYLNKEKKIKVKPEISKKWAQTTLEAQVKQIAIKREAKNPEWIDEARDLVENAADSTALKPIRLWLIESDLKEGKTAEVRTALTNFEQTLGAESLGASEWELKFQLENKGGNRQEALRALENLTRSDEKKWKHWFVLRAWASNYKVEKCFSDVCAEIKKLESQSISQEEKDAFNAVFHKRAKHYRKWIEDWKNVDPIQSQSFLSRNREISKKWFELMRSDLRKLVPVKSLSERALINRIEWVLEIERQGKQTFKLPYLTLRRDAIEVVAGIYEDFETDVNNALNGRPVSPELAEGIKEMKKKRLELVEAVKSVDQKLAELSSSVEKQITSADPLVKSECNQANPNSPRDIANLIFTLQEHNLKDFSVEGWSYWKAQTKSARRLSYEKPLDH